MDRDRSSTSPWEYMGFELEVRKGGPREHPVTIRSLAGETLVLPTRELLYDSARDEYLYFSSKTPLVRYLELPRPVERLSVVLPPGILGTVVGHLCLGQPNAERE